MPENEKSGFRVYCNAIEFGYSPWDIRLIIKELVEARDQQTTFVTHGTIAMSPVHAKAALEALQKTVAIYEEKFGEIDISKIKEVTEGVTHSAA